MDGGGLRLNVLIGLAFSGAGLLFFVVGLVLVLVQRRRAKRCTGQAVGTLEMNGLFYRPTVMYTVDGEALRFKINTRGGRALWRRELVICYNPAKPADAFLRGNTDLAFYFVGGIFIFIGLVSLGFGIFFTMALPQ